MITAPVALPVADEQLADLLRQRAQQIEAEQLDPDLEWISDGFGDTYDLAPPQSSGQAAILRLAAEALSGPGELESGPWAAVQQNVLDALGAIASGGGPNDQATISRAKDLLLAAISLIDHTAPNGSGQ